MLSLELCTCYSDIFLSSRPRIAVATAYITGYVVVVVVVVVVVFFTLTDRASTIPNNTRGCQSGTWSAGQKLLLLIHTYSAQRIVLATEETTVTQQVSHRPIKCQSRLWSQRGTKVNGSHHGDNPLLRPTGIQIATKVMRLFKHWHRPISKRLIKPPYSISRETRSTPNVVAYPRPAFSATNRKNYAPTSFDQQVQVFQGHILYRNKKN